MTLPIDIITKEIMQQYEVIRANGACNMLDRRCVQEVADLAGFHSLASLTKDEYVLILGHYDELMRHHSIQPLRRQQAEEWAW